VKSFGIVSVLATSLRVWRQNFVAFTLIALAIYVPALVLRLVLPPTYYVWLMVPVGTLLNAIIAAAVTYGVIMELHGTRPSYRDCITRGFAHVGPTLGVSVLSLLAVIGGLLLLAVPGIIVMLMLWVAVPVAVTEKPGVMASLRRSRELTDGHKARLLVILVIVWCASYALHAALEDAFEPSALAVVWLARDAVLGLFYALTAAVAYAQLRALKEGTQMPELARAFAKLRKHG
jgi:hypothetical protein